jgi:uncharacterized protein
MTVRYCTTKHETLEDDLICSLLVGCNRIAVVGLSDKPGRVSHRVALYLLDQGYDVVPVNPEIKETLGRRSYHDLLAVPEPVEIAVIFRREEFIPLIVAEAIELSAKAIWMQSGLADIRSAEAARRAGLAVVMDRCIMVEHGVHFG